MTDTVKATLNGVPTSFSPGTTLKDVLESLTTSAVGCAIACNGDVVLRGQWAVRCVQAGDRLEVLSAAQGG